MIHQIKLRAWPKGLSGEPPKTDCEQKNRRGLNRIRPEQYLGTLYVEGNLFLSEAFDS